MYYSNTRVALLIALIHPKCGCFFVHKYKDNLCEDNVKPDQRLSVTGVGKS